MAWLVVDKDSSEWIFDVKPQRKHYEWDIRQVYNMYVELSQSSIKKLIGRELTWEDEPVEI